MAVVTKLQMVQNQAARVFEKTCICRLHWLPIDVSIILLLIVYEAVHGLASQYIRVRMCNNAFYRTLHNTDRNRP